MAAERSLRRAQDGPKTLPKRSNIDVGSEVGIKTDLGANLDRLGRDSGAMWERFRSDVRLIFVRFWLGFIDKLRVTPWVELAIVSGQTISFETQ